jgi:hypothetical protein
MVKLLTDNNIDNVNLYPLNGQSYAWDDTLTSNQAVNQSAQNSGTIYATKALVNGSVLSIVKSTGSGVTVGGSASANNYYTPVNSLYMVKYEKTLRAEYIAVGGEQTFTPVDGSGNPLLIGASIIQITREIQPLHTTDYTLNSSTGMLTLTGAPLAALETCYIIAGIMITS